MANKRSRERETHEPDADSALSDSDEEIFHDASRAKRARHASFPQVSRPKAAISFLTPKKARIAPYPLKAHDSPSNPFSRNHIQTFVRSLPPPTTFRHHLPLRFQFVRKDVPPQNGGVYRIVQVPLSYTFTHLRCLIAFLFGASLGQSARPTKPEDEHLFELKKNIDKYSARYKPGQIKTGRTWAKLSTTQDPCSWQAEEADIEDDDNGGVGVSDGQEEGESEERDMWQWKDEDESNLQHAWPEGLDTHRGIIYYHSRTTQVHITINDTKIEKRRGKGNTPYIFFARGRVHLSPPPLPRLSFEPAPSRAKHAGVPSKANNRAKHDEPLETTATDEPDAEGELEEESENREFDVTHPFYGIKLRSLYDDEEEEDVEEEYGEYEEEDDEEDFTAEPNPNRWNKPETAFLTYLKQYMGPVPRSKPFTLFDDDDDEDDPLANQSLESDFLATPGLTHSDNFSSPPPPTSSPACSSSPVKIIPYLKPRVRIDVPSSPSRSPEAAAVILSHFPSMKYKHTPAPPRTRIQRMRIQRVERQIEKSKRVGLQELEAEEEEQGDEGDDDEDEQVDELIDEGILDGLEDEIEV